MSPGSTARRSGKRNSAKPSHLDSSGKIQMVDVSGKQPSARRAVAEGTVVMSAKTASLLRNNLLEKGDAVTTARVAGIMAAKKTADLIPLCHPLPITDVQIQISIKRSSALIRAEAATTAQTGVEMEALTAVAVSALTIYDMCKSVERGITITDVGLISKTGGKSDWVANDG